MKKIIDPYLTIINTKNKYSPNNFKHFEYERVSVTDGDWGKTTALIEKNTKTAYDNVLADFERFGIGCKLMSAKRSNWDQLYAKAETFIIKLNKSANEILKEKNPNLDSDSKNKKLIKKFATILKNPKLIKGAHLHQKEYTANFGHSEHASGLAVDIKVDMSNVVIPDQIRARYPEASQGELNFLTRRMIMEKHGFVLTYPVDDRLEEVTGMPHPEGWHWRYIGKEHSQMIARLRENINKQLNSRHEVFLEDYVKLLEYDVTASNQEELLNKYTDLFKDEILNLNNSSHL